MALSQLLLIVATALSLGAVEAQAKVRRPYVDPPPEIYTAPAPAAPDVDATGSLQAAPPVIEDPSFFARPYGTVQRSGCTTTTYMTGEMMDHPVRVHRC